MMFPLWFLQLLVVGGLVLCGIGVLMLIAFLIVDSKDRQIW